MVFKTTTHASHLPEVKSIAGAHEERQKTVGSRQKTVVSQTDSDSESLPKTKRKPDVKAAAKEAPWHVRTFRDVDVALVCGDAWMVATTHMVTDLIPISELTTFTMVALPLWGTIAAIRGDYTSYARIQEEGSFLVGWSVYVGVLQACFSWLFFTVGHLLTLSFLITHGLLDSAPVIDIEAGARVPPILEVDVALLITMSAWRGMYYALRERIL
jgi:hypothetical protein